MFSWTLMLASDKARHCIAVEELFSCCSCCIDTLHVFFSCLHSFVSLMEQSFKCSFQFLFFALAFVKQNLFDDPVFKFETKPFWLLSWDYLRSTMGIICGTVNHSLWTLTLFLSADFLAEKKSHVLLEVIDVNVHRYINLTKSTREASFKFLT